MEKPNLFLQLEQHPEHAAGIVTVSQLNEMLAAGQITWDGAASICPSSALGLLKAPKFLRQSAQEA